MFLFSFVLVDERREEKEERRLENVGLSRPVVSSACGVGTLFCKKHPCKMLCIPILQGIRMCQCNIMLLVLGWSKVKISTQP